MPEYVSNHRCTNALVSPAVMPLEWNASLILLYVSYPLSIEHAQHNKCMLCPSVCLHLFYFPAICLVLNRIERHPGKETQLMQQNRCLPKPKVDVPQKILPRKKSKAAKKTHVMSPTHLISDLFNATNPRPHPPEVNKPRDIIPKEERKGNTEHACIGIYRCCPFATSPSEIYAPKAYINDICAKLPYICVQCTRIYAKMSDTHTTTRRNSSDAKQLNNHTSNTHGNTSLLISFKTRRQRPLWSQSHASNYDHLMQHPPIYSRFCTPCKFSNHCKQRWMHVLSTTHAC